MELCVGRGQGDGRSHPGEDRSQRGGKWKGKNQLPNSPDAEALLLWDLAWGSCSFPSIKGIKRALCLDG